MAKAAGKVKCYKNVANMRAHLTQHFAKVNRRKKGRNLLIRLPTDSEKPACNNMLATEQTEL